MILQHRPITAWPGKLTQAYRVSPFRATWSQTLVLLDRELTHLGARSPVVLQVAVNAGNDDWLVNVKDDPSFALALYKDAAKILHPDQGGDPALFRKLTQARDLLVAHFGPLR